MVETGGESLSRPEAEWRTGLDDSQFLQFFPKLAKKDDCAAVLDSLNCLTINTRCPTIGFYHLPCPPQNILTIYFVIESMEPSSGTPFGRPV